MPELPLPAVISRLKPKEVTAFGDDIRISGVVCRPGEIPEAAATGGVLYCVIDEFLEYGIWKSGAAYLTGALSHSNESLDGRIGAIVTEQPMAELSIPQLIVADAKKAAAVAAKTFHNAPDERMEVACVTGTNGKTTTTTLIGRLLAAGGHRPAALGTLGAFYENRLFKDVIYTTPLATDLFCVLGELESAGADAAAVEVSSHALDLDRTFGLDVDVAVFTNLSRDHLDYHGDMETYGAAKVRLFTNLKPGAAAVVNTDDPYGAVIAAAAPGRVITTGIKKTADLRATDIICTTTGTRFFLHHKNDEPVRVKTPLLGRFNVENTLSAFGAGLALGIGMTEMREAAAAFSGIPGRMQAVPMPERRVGVVDYSHTPDSLEKALQTLRDLNPPRIITVFGCGGDRDRGKRPMMGEIAHRLSDVIVVTSDNPRTEDPDAVIGDILAGLPKNQGPETVIIEPDRRAAIGRAYRESRPGEVILVAGKGHETYQIIGEVKIPFDDREELRALA
jgi:UDP-N-acetylmuramoyl-L-alanyl-D-glutamate--2,6-diaminopimelate ligase